MLKKEIINQLLDTTGSNCISIYIPTHRAGDSQGDRIRFKNAIADAEAQLKQQGLNEPETKNLLREAKSFIDNADFWLDQSDGLAMFIGPDHFSHHKLPIRFESFVMVSDHFYLLPLLPIVNKDRDFMILALSQNEIKLYQAQPYGITPVVIDDLVPDGKEELMAYIEAQPSIQLHDSGNGNSAVFHGQGGGKELEGERILEYFRHIDKGLQEIYRDNKMPLVVACVDYLFPIFQKANTYPHLMEFNISGNPEHEDVVLLHEKAMIPMKEIFDKDKKEKKENFTGYMAEDKASFSLDGIVKAAVEGRVDTLYVNHEVKTWGEYNTESHKIVVEKEYQPGARCLLDFAAREAFRSGAQIHNVTREELPQPTANINAIFRY